MKEFFINLLVLISVPFYILFLLIKFMFEIVRNGLILPLMAKTSHLIKITKSDYKEIINNI